MVRKYGLKSKFCPINVTTLFYIWFEVSISLFFVERGFKNSYVENTFDNTYKALKIYFKNFNEQKSIKQSKNCFKSEIV